MSAKLDALLSQYATAVARAPKRKPRKRRDGEMTAQAQAVAIAAAEAKAEAARVELDARAAREEREYYRRVGRLSHLGKRRAAIERAMAAEPHMVTRRYAECVRALTAIGAAQSAVFGLPIIAAELYEGGRFYRRATWLGLKVGMTAADAIDLVAIAVELSYVKGQTAEDAHGRRMPTVGAMYRNLRLAFNAEVERFRRNKSAGAVALYSLDAIAENMGEQWFEANASRIEYLGYGFDLRATDVDALYPAAMVPTEMAETSRAALKWAAARREAIARLARMEQAARDTLAANAATPEGLDRATFEADRLAIRAIINGATIADIAAFTNNSVATVTERLLELEGRLGATWHSTQGSEPVHSTFEHSKRPARWERERWSTNRDGTRASEVTVTRR